MGPCAASVMRSMSSGNCSGGSLRDSSTICSTVIGMDRTKRKSAAASKRELLDGGLDFLHDAQGGNAASAACPPQVGWVLVNGISATNASHRLQQFCQESSHDP